ncbi:MAG: YecA family protein [Gammaproteobacteria bacterium]|nr:YecA family protein [Gammaproteobacteria bacterium]
MSTPLSETDLDRLEELLDGYPDGLTLDSLQGLVAALASSPKPLARADWHKAALATDETAEPELAALLDRFYAETESQLATGQEFPFLVYGSEDDEERPDYEGWCAGYVHGFTLTPSEVYEEAVDAEEMDELLHPILLLSGVLKESLEGTDEWMKPEEEEAAYAEAEDDLGVSVRGLYVLTHPVMKH